MQGLICIDVMSLNSFLIAASLMVHFVELLLAILAVLIFETRIAADHLFVIAFAIVPRRYHYSKDRPTDVRASQ